MARSSHLVSFGQPFSGSRHKVSCICPRAEHPNKRELYEFRDTEKDPRYQRRDMSLEHWSEFLLRFLAELEK